MSKIYHHLPELLHAFPKVSPENWQEVLVKQMRPELLSRLLAGKERDGLQLLPLYTRAGEGQASAGPAQLPGRGWQYHEYVRLDEHADSRQLNSRLLESLREGAFGIDLRFLTERSLEEGFIRTLLHQVQTAICPVSWYMGPAQQSAFDTFRQFLQDFPNAAGTLYLEPDTEAAFPAGQLCQLFGAEEKAFHRLGISGMPFAEEGCSSVQELAFCLSYLVACLDVLTGQGLAAGKLMACLEVTLSMSPNYFTGIAKFSAMRLLLDQLAADYQLQPAEMPAWHIRAMSCTWNKTLYDPVTNMLRNTTEAMGAIAGGCQAITLLPHDFMQAGGGTGSRLAHQLSAILQHEAHLDDTANPAAGAYALETLSRQLAARSWDMFLALEQKGGYAEAGCRTEIQQHIAAYREEQQQLINSREQVVVGATRYANTNENRAGMQESPAPVLNRGAAAFEMLRMAVERYGQQQRQPVVGLLAACLQAADQALVHARIAFIQDLLAVVGIGAKVLNWQPHTALPELPGVVVVCGGDAFDEQQAEALQKALTQQQQPVVYLAGKPALPAAFRQHIAVRRLIHTGADMYDIVKDIITQLGIRL